jgi:hypothetical protein
MDLIEFLLARIADDEAAAQGIAEDVGEWMGDRWRAECDAKRRIVERLVAGIPDEDVMDGYEMDGWEQARNATLPLLALPYADHPDYDEAWRP